MAIVRLTDLYSNLNHWPGDLLTASDGVSFGAFGATSFSYTYTAGTKFAGFTVTSTGTGFTYDGTTPTGGTMSGLIIKDAGGHTVLSVANIAAGSLASDLALFASYEFGWTDPGGGGTGGQQKNAWSQLLSGNDTYTGTAGDDRQGMVGVDAGRDVFNMGAGDDRVSGGMGNDTINGGDGWDQLDYGQTHWNEGIPMVRGITVTAATGTVADPYGYTDRFTGIEEIHGSATGDRFIGGPNGMNFMGLRGADTIIGGASGDDWALYSDDTWLGGSRGINVNLQTGLAGGNILGRIVDGFGNVDHTVNIRNVAGTRYDDRFFGSAGDDFFAGGEGKDSYNGRAGSDDGIMFNWNFSDAIQGGISVDLSRAVGQIRNDGFGNVENAFSIETIAGSQQNDLIKGNSGRNRLDGREGADTLTGNGGDDEFKWRVRDELGQGDIVTDFHTGAGADQDTLRFQVSNWGATTTLHLVNGTQSTLADSTFLFNAATHILSWDEDGTGSLAAIAIVRLDNVASLLSENFDLR